MLWKVALANVAVAYVAVGKVAVEQTSETMATFDRERIILGQF